MENIYFLKKDPYLKRFYIKTRDVEGNRGDTGPTGPQGDTGATGTLEYFTSSLDTSCNYPINILDPLPLVEPDVTISLNTRGRGALIRSNEGDCRGNYAVDLQNSRVNPSEVASGNFSTLSGGRINAASGGASTVSGGQVNSASGDISTVSGGSFNTASGDISTISGGGGNTASGDYSVISGGRNNTASGDFSNISGGQVNTALGNSSSISGGIGNTAIGISSSILGGQGNTTLGFSSSVSGGIGNTASGDFSGTLAGEGLLTTFPHSAAVGTYNQPGPIGGIGTERIFMIGYGPDDNNRENLFSVTLNGNANINGTYETTGADYGEYFEAFQASKKLPLGTSVTFAQGKLIRPATSSDIPIGVVSNSCSISGNGGEEWQGKYLRDEDNNYIYENGKKKISPLYDPTKEYIPRSSRPEWNLVGLLGQLKILKGQPVAPHWRYLEEFNHKYDLYFIR